MKTVQTFPPNQIKVIGQILRTTGLVLVAILVTIWLDTALGIYFPGDEVLPGGVVFTAIATGWILHLLTSLFHLKEKFLRYLEFLAVLMFVGVLPLVPGLILVTMIPTLPIWVALGAIPMSAALMLELHHNNTPKLGLNKKWTRIWATHLDLSALGILLFNLLF